MACFLVDRCFYPKVALVKAVHRFLNCFYVFIEADERNFCINWESKDESLNSYNFEAEFKNELLTQLIRYEVFQQTKTIGQLTLARAFASSMYTSETKEDAENAETMSNINIDAVLSEWGSNDEG